MQKLTEQNVAQIKDNPIYLVGKSLCYVQELCDKYDFLEQIAGIIDSNKRNAGELLYWGRKIPVYEIAYLKEMICEKPALIIMDDYYREVGEEIASVCGADISGIPIYYFASQETEYEEYYREKYKHASLENILVFRSGPHASSYVKGMDFADNARALFDYALQSGLNRTWELIWLVKNPAEYGQYDFVENVSFLSFDWSVSEKQSERDAYYRAMCLARYVFFTDAYGFARNCRKDQIRVQLWHGCGFKTRVNFVRCEKRYEYTTVISDLYANIHAEIYGLRKDQILVTGYAKQDWLFHPEKKDLKKLQIPEAGKYIFWLPTFRATEHKLEYLNEYELASETGLPVINTREEMKRLNGLLAAKNMMLIIKLHPFQNQKLIHCEDSTHIHLVENEDLTQQDIPINRLLGQADALISDYSSAAVDYLLLDRPVAFMLEDVEEYENSRGFVFENIREWLPGKEIFTCEDVHSFVKEIAENQDTTADKRRRLKSVMHRYSDDHSCRRIMEALHI